MQSSIERRKRMKKKTYNILSRIPIINTYVKYVVCDPTMYSSPFIASDLWPKVLAYSAKHPDVQITRKILHRIINS